MLSGELHIGVRAGPIRSYNLRKRGGFDMRFSKLFFSLLILIFTFGVSGCASAADNETSPASDLKYQLQGGRFSETAAGPGKPGLPVLSLADSVVARRIGRARMGINPNANVCFTIRSYKVKRTERLA